MADPWDDCKGWGPGPMEDFVILTNQRGQHEDPIEVFNIFIKRNVDTIWQGHLLDSDDNDGEEVRRAIRRAIKRAKKKAKA